MVIFLNLDGTARKVVPEHVFQGSNNVVDVEVLTGYPATTGLEINFLLPDGAYAYESYQPMLYVPYEVQPLVGAYTYTLGRTVTEQAGNCYAAINAVDANGNRTSFLVKFTVEPSVLPELPPAPEPDIYELILRYLQEQGAAIAQLDDRVTRLENVNIRRVMTDLTCEVKESAAIFTKWYSDGTTASFSVPLSGGGSFGGNGLVAVTFRKESFVNVRPPTEAAEYELAFAPQQTGMRSSQFLLSLDVKESCSYEVGNELVPALREGYSTLANRAFKGSDGSVLLMGVRVPFDGKLLLYNGKIDGSVENVTGVYLTDDKKGLVVSYRNAPSETLYPDFYSRAEVDALIAPYVKDVSADDWSAEPDGYFYTVLASEHGKGINPTVSFRTLATGAKVAPGVTVSAEGNVELSATVSTAIRIIVK